MKSGIIFLVSLLLSIFFQPEQLFSGKQAGKFNGDNFLDDAIQLARGMNPKGRQAGEEVKAAQERVTEAKLAEAELAGLKARYDYVVNVYAFRRAAGDLLDQ